MEMTVLLVHRAHRFSPNCVERDAALLRTIGEALEAKGFRVEHVEETQLTAEVLQRAPSRIVSMARSKVAVTLLRDWDMQEGHKVWNAPQAVLHNTRARQTLRFIEANIPLPPSEVTNRPCETSLNFPLWVKMGGGDAEAEADVRYFASREELLCADFSDVTPYVVSEHVEGDLVKFYGIAGTPFFYVYYPTLGKSGFSKFGLEAHNGVPQEYAYDVEALYRLTTKAASVSGFTLYGGDCIVRPDGTFALIDFNDFPSFAPCVTEAARAFTALFLQS